MSAPQPPSTQALAALRRFVRRRAPVEQCELCSAQLAANHQHLVEPTARQLLCACTACSILFSHQSQGKYRLVPQRVQFLPQLQLTDAQWDSLTIPIGLAFFYCSTPAGKVVAFYPSPAGPTESLLDLTAWTEIVDANPALNNLTPDVEALLVNRVGHAAGLTEQTDHEYYLVPIDECYKLVGLIRRSWRGFSGGPEVRQEIGRFFGELKQRAGVTGG